MDLRVEELPARRRRPGAHECPAGAAGALALDHGKLAAEIYIDRSLIEAFFNDEKSISMRSYSGYESQGMQLFADGKVSVDELYVSEMKGIY